MFTFFRTVLEKLERAGIYVTTKRGVRLELLFCGCGFKGSRRGMKLARFFFKKVAAVSS